MVILGGFEFDPFTAADIPAFTPCMKRVFDEDTRRRLSESQGGLDGYGGFFREWYFSKAVFKKS